MLEFHKWWTNNLYDLETKCKHKKDAFSVLKNSSVKWGTFGNLKLVLLQEMLLTLRPQYYDRHKLKSVLLIFWKYNSFFFKTLVMCNGIRLLIIFHWELPLLLLKSNLSCKTQIHTGYLFFSVTLITFWSVVFNVRRIWQIYGRS